jgi:hypothetical protein
MSTTSIQFPGRSSRARYTEPRRLSRLCAAILGLATSALAATPAGIDCADSRSLTPQLVVLCQQLNGVSQVEQYKFAITPRSALYSPARARVAAGDDSLARRVALYEERWVDAERIRRRANDAIAGEVEALLASGNQLTPSSYLELLSPATQRLARDYIRTARLADEVWLPEPLPDDRHQSESQQPTAVPPETRPAGGKPVLQWITPDSSNEPRRTADLEGAVGLLEERELKERLRAQAPSPAQPESEMDRMDRRLDASLQRVTPDGGAGLQGSSGATMLPGSGVTPTPGVPANPSGPIALPTAPGAPPPPGTPGPLPTEPYPTTPPAPPVPGGPNPYPSPVPPSKAACMSDAELDSFNRRIGSMLEALQKNANDDEAMRRIQTENCNFYKTFRAKCPSDFDAMFGKTLAQIGMTSQQFETMICTISDGGGMEPGGNEQTMIVAACDNGGFECRESQAKMATLCVTIPPGAKNVQFRLFTKFPDEAKFEEVAVGHDARWARFVDAGMQDGKVCAIFANWSHDRSRVAKIIVTYDGMKNPPNP